MGLLMGGCERGDAEKNMNGQKGDVERVFVDLLLFSHLLWTLVCICSFDLVAL